MDIVAKNPYRTFGVFANDSIRQRTANKAKIVAFRKVNKNVSFLADAEAFLGPIQRDDADLQEAESLLSSKLASATNALFWFHADEARSVLFGRLTKESLPGFIKLQLLDPDYASLINVAVAMLTSGEYGASAKYYTLFLESGEYWDDFRNAIGVSKQDASGKEILDRFINDLAQSYPSVDWWRLFSDSAKGSSILRHIKRAFEGLAITAIQKHVGNYTPGVSHTSAGILASIQALKAKCEKHVAAIMPLEGKSISPSGQIALDKLGTKVLTELKSFYKTGKIGDEMSAIPTLQLAQYALSISANSGVAEECRDFVKELEGDVKKLPPQEVSQYAAAIREEIRGYCLKPDELRWSLLLVKNCIPHLKKIKEKLGANHSYYLSVSRRIADNALYNLDTELDSYEKATRNGQAGEEKRAVFKNSIHKAKELVLYLEILDLPADFKNGRLAQKQEKVDRLVSSYNVDCGDISFGMTLLSDEELLAQCVDYQSLVEFCQTHSDSPLLGQAIQKKWDMESAAFPTQHNIKSLLAYKEKFPNSHKDPLVAQMLDVLLFGSQNASVQDYRKFIELFSGHPRRLEAMFRVDRISFDSCRTIEDLNRYLKDFPNGAFRNTALERIDDAARFLACKTALEYNQYIIHNPNGRHCGQAMRKIEDLAYDAAKSSHDYSKYFDRYPKGRYVEELKRDEEKYFFNLCREKGDYRTYLKRYPNGQYVTTAKGALEKKRHKLLDTIACIAAVALIVGAVIARLSNTNLQHAASQVDSSPQSGYADITDSGQTEQETELPTNSAEAEVPTEAVLTEADIWGGNSLSTGDKPYSSYFGKSQGGDNYISFKTSDDSDYVVIVKRESDGKYMNHIYINGGDRATLYLPDGTFMVYFYSGKGWNPNKEKGSLMGGFVSHESQQQDGPIELYSAWVEYTLYPVQNGNLRLESADEFDMFN